MLCDQSLVQPEEIIVPLTQTPLLSICARLSAHLKIVETDISDLLYARYFNDKPWAGPLSPSVPFGFLLISTVNQALFVGFLEIFCGTGTDLRFLLLCQKKGT